MTRTLRLDHIKYPLTHTRDSTRSLSPAYTKYPLTHTRDSTQSLCPAEHKTSLPRQLATHSRPHPSTPSQSFPACFHSHGLISTMS
jgi:hypothetical protein